MKLKIWCDSGANARSKREVIVELSDIGFTEEEWKRLHEDEKEQIAKEVAFEQLDWGFEEVE